MTAGPNDTFERENDMGLGWRSGLFVAMLLVSMSAAPTPSIAQEPSGEGHLLLIDGHLATGVHYLRLTVSPTGEIKATIVRPTRVSNGGTDPGGNSPVADGFKMDLEALTSGVETYENLSRDRKVLHYSYRLVSEGVRTGKVPSAEALGFSRKLRDQALGANSGKWEAWASHVDGHLGSAADKSGVADVVANALIAGESQAEEAGEGFRLVLPVLLSLLRNTDLGDARFLTIIEKVIELIDLFSR